MGYNLAEGRRLNFEKRRRTILQPFVPEEKMPDYYQKTGRGLGYVTTPESFSGEKTEERQYDHSSESLCWDSDVSIGIIFREVSANMAFTIQEDEDLKESSPIRDDPWAKHLNMKWEIQFEQREPPTKDKVIQINMGVLAVKISKSKGFSTTERGANSVAPRLANFSLMLSKTRSYQ